MTPRGRRVVLALASVAGIAVLLVVGGWWLVYTEAGARWGFERLGGIVPGQLDVLEMRGPLHGPLEVREFTYRTERMEIKAKRVVIDWRLRELLRRRLDIHSLRAEGVRILVGAPGDNPEARDSLRGPLPDLDLPVAIIVRDGLLEDVRITTPSNDSGLVLDRVTMAARSLRGDSLHVNRFAVESKRLDVEFAGRAMPRGAYPVYLRGAWTYRPEGRPEIQGAGTISGTLDTLHVEQELSGPFAARVDLRLFQPLRALRFGGDVAFSRFTPRDLDRSWPAGTFTGRADLAGNLDVFTATGSVSGDGTALGPAAADFRVRRASRVWHVEDAVVTRPGSDARLTARGTVTIDSLAQRFDLRTSWRGMAWPLEGEPWVVSESGEARLVGTARDFTIDLEALLAGRDLPPGTWQLDGRGGNGRLAIRTIVADILDGRIVGTGSVAWEPRVSWRLSFDGTGINPGTVWPQYPGVLAFAGRSEGTTGSGGASGRILVSRLDGTLRGQPVAAQGTLTARSGQYSLAGGSLQWGPNRAEASGGFGRSWSLAWKLDAPKLGAALAQASGSLRGEGTVEGARGRPHVQGTLTGDSLFFGTAHATALRAEVDLNLAPGGAVRLDATATQVNLGSRSAERIVLAGNGTREAHELRASFAGREDSTVAVLAGAFVGDGWSGEMRALDLVHPRTGNWSLAGPASISLGARRADLSDFVWQSGASRLSLDADWVRGAGWSLDSRLERVELALFEPLLPPRLRLEGPLAGHAVVRGTGTGRVFADVQLTPGPGRVLHHTGSGQWVPTAFENGSLRATADGRRLSAFLGADFVGAGSVRATLASPAYADAATAAQLPIDGRVAVHLSDIAMLQGFTTELDSTAGALDADLALGGRLGRPSIQGPVTLRNGSAYVPRFGLRLREAALRATSSPGGRLALDGSVLSGPGRLTFQGTAAFAEGAKPTARLDVAGRRVQAMNTRDVRFLASPDLHVVLDGKRLDVTGEVVIPEGRIDVGEADDDQVVQASSDVVYTGSDTLSARPSEIYSRVRVVLEKDVVVRGFGLEVKPTGSVVATDAPGLPTLGTGRLVIQDGTYTIYGQELQVEQGTLIFGGGPITDPAVRVRASRRAPDGVVAGFDVRGTASRPDVRVFSEPPMGQSEALSYILFGKPIERGSLSEAQIASTMATTLGVPGTNLIAHGIASELGIEHARIDVGSSFESTSLTLGTHIAPKLYLSYGMDVFDAESAIRLRYILNRVFTIEAETAQQNRFDILYTVEK